MSAKTDFQEKYSGGFYGDNTSMKKRLYELAGQVYDALYDPTSPTVTAITDNLSLDETHHGDVLLVTADAKTITLPATTAGLRFFIVNGNADGNGITISPAAADKIVGSFVNPSGVLVSMTGTDNKDLVNTKATAKKGDFLILVADGVDGWYIEHCQGIWTEESQVVVGPKKVVEIKTDNYSVTAADSGKVFGIGTDAKVFSLPATVAGLNYTFINTGAAGNNILTISPVAADGISGTITLAASVVVDAGVVNKDLINTKATAKAGDCVTLIGTGVTGSTAWIIVSSTGIWASEV